MILKEYQYGEMFEGDVKNEAHIYFIEISSNVYYVVKDRNGDHVGNYVDGSFVCKCLNSGLRVGIKSLKDGVLANFHQRRTVE